MKPWALLPVLLFGCQACTRDCESPRHVELEARLAEWDASAGAQFADRYFTFFRTPIDPCEAQYRRWLYIDRFFLGFTSPEASFDETYGEPPPEFPVMEAGLRAGKEYRRAHPELVAATYISFGYNPISTEGVWTTGFEKSNFVPVEG